MLIYPNHPDFNSWLAIPPPSWQNHSQTEEIALVVDSSSGIMRPATPDEFWEYALGGEYDERLEAIEEDDDLFG